MSNKKVRKVVSMLAVLALVFSMLSIGVVNAQTGEVEQAKNVILLIGDGMGYNHWELCKQVSGEDELFVENGFEYYGYSHTRSFTSKVTDSAAGGTALATGVRTYNRGVGVYVYDPLAIRAPKNLCELAMELGMKTGVVTSDSNVGATPGAFTAHTADRRNYLDMSQQQVKSGIDLIWTSSSGIITDEYLKGTEYVLVNDWNELNALKDGQKSMGQFDTDLWKTSNDDNCPTLSELTTEAIERLDNKDGFFLMVEGAHVDKHSHNQDPKNMTEAMLEFDKTIEAAVEFAKEDGDTIVIVSADHETGNITLKDGKYVYTQGSHSATDVPVCVYGTDDFIEDEQAVDNKDIPKFIAKALGATDKQFPARVNPDSKFYIKDFIGYIGVIISAIGEIIGL